MKRIILVLLLLVSALASAQFYNEGPTYAYTPHDPREIIPQGSLIDWWTTDPSTMNTKTDGTGTTPGTGGAIAKWVGEFAGLSVTTSGNVTTPTLTLNTIGSASSANFGSSTSGMIGALSKTLNAATVIIIGKSNVNPPTLTFKSFFAVGPDTTTNADNTVNGFDCCWWTATDAAITHNSNSFPAAVIGQTISNNSPFMLVFQADMSGANGSTEVLSAYLNGGFPATALGQANTTIAMTNLSIGGRTDTRSSPNAMICDVIFCSTALSGRTLESLYLNYVKWHYGGVL